MRSPPTSPWSRTGPNGSRCADLAYRDLTHGAARWRAERELRQAVPWAFTNTLYWRKKLQ
jgi:hypothetical protein